LRERIGGEYTLDIIDTERLVGRFDFNLDIAPCPQPERLKASILAADEANGIAQAADRLAFDVVAIALVASGVEQAFGVDEVRCQYARQALWFSDSFLASPAHSRR
jgi:hypothetical protein